MSDEKLTRIDEKGNIIGEVGRSDAHAKGFWHRAVSIFVFNTRGEILLEKRSEHKDLFPGHYDIVGGHVQYNQSAAVTAHEEVAEELSLRVAPDRLKQIGKEDSIVERVILPEKGIINLERKTVYFLEISSEEEAELLRKSGQWSKLSPDDLKVKGVFGEVTHVEFWSWESLIQSMRSETRSIFASATHTALADKVVADEVRHIALELRKKVRERFFNSIPFRPDVSPENAEFDTWLFKAFYPDAGQSNDSMMLYDLFSGGPRQCPGAYRMGEFRRQMAGDAFWKDKLDDPSGGYVENILNAIKLGADSQTTSFLDRSVSAIKNFVGELLNLPLCNGKRFRDDFGNLVDISVARNAVIHWIKFQGDRLGHSALVHPTAAITDACLQAGEIALQRHHGLLLPHDSYQRILALIKLGLAASIADFNTPIFREKIKSVPPGRSMYEAIADLIDPVDLSDKLGDDRFVRKFYEKYIEHSPRCVIAYLPGNVAQAPFSLAIAQEICDANPNAKIVFIPKSDYTGNDVSINDVKNITAHFKDSCLQNLNYLIVEKRFVILEQGPRTHGLDPSSLHSTVVDALSLADVILVEGQAYAEMRGWRRPVFAAFRVNGRVAEAIHGLRHDSEVCGFVFLHPGVSHFANVPAPNVSEGRHLRDNLKCQTTVEYVEAILHDNLGLIATQLFHDDFMETVRRICTEADTLNTSFARIILGGFEAPPADTEIQEFRNRRYRVFAIGGGGGFNAVTLKALKDLNIFTAAGVPSTDDGGSTGNLQKMLRKTHGFVFGVGDLASILQDVIPSKGKQAVLAYRFDYEPASLVVGVMKRIADEAAAAQSDLASATDFYSFVCNQLNLARIIDLSIRKGNANILKLHDASIRNLNIIAAFEFCGALKTSVPRDRQIAVILTLERALHLKPHLCALPVTFFEGRLFLEFDSPIPPQFTEGLAPGDFDAVDHRIYGQHNIDKCKIPGRRRLAGVKKGPQELQANPEYVELMHKAELIIMGAGSLVSSQLSQLGIPGVVDTLVQSTNARRLLVLNHVKMDETTGMSLKDHVQLIEAVANDMCDGAVKNKITGNKRELQIGDVFTDIVVPRTVARELQEEMDRARYVWSEPANPVSNYCNIVTKSGGEISVFCNRYVDFIRKNSAIAKKYDITGREIEILSFLEQPEALYTNRMEKGRYRGAMYATTGDINYLVAHGIQRRSIHEVDSIGKNTKIVKSAGDCAIEYFPGIMAESLMGIIKIALERGTDTI